MVIKCKNSQGVGTIVLSLFQIKSLHQFLMAINYCFIWLLRRNPLNSVYFESPCISQSLKCEAFPQQNVLFSCTTVVGKEETSEFILPWEVTEIAQHSILLSHVVELYCSVMNTLGINVFLLSVCEQPTITLLFLSSLGSEHKCIHNSTRQNNFCKFQCKTYLFISEFLSQVLGFLNSRHLTILSSLLDLQLVLDDGKLLIPSVLLSQTMLQ